MSPSLGGEKEIRPPPAENKETTNTQDGGDHRCPKCEATFSHPLVLSLHQMSEHSGKSVKLSILITGLVTNSKFCWLFKDRCEKVCFLQTHNQGLRQLFFDCVLGPLRQAWPTWQCPCRIEVPKAMHEASWRPLKGPVSAQKALSRVWDGDKGVAGRNGREKCYPDEGSLICPPDK